MNLSRKNLAATKPKAKYIAYKKCQALGAPLSLQIESIGYFERQTETEASIKPFHPPVSSISASKIKLAARKYAHSTPPIAMPVDRERESEEISRFNAYVEG
ncbi:hypothetical protein U1Q18_044034 [Sarracenia purpurea var. burkii]